MQYVGHIEHCFIHQWTTSIVGEKINIVTCIWHSLLLTLLWKPWAEEKPRSFLFSYFFCLFTPSISFPKATAHAKKSICVTELDMSSLNLLLQDTGTWYGKYLTTFLLTNTNSSKAFERKKELIACPFNTSMLS